MKTDFRKLFSTYKSITIGIAILGGTTAFGEQEIPLSNDFASVSKFDVSSLKEDPKDSGVTEIRSDNVRELSSLVFDNFSTPVDGNNNVGGIHSDDHTLAASIAANTLTLHGATGGYWYSTFPLGTCGNESAYSALSFTAKASSNVTIQVNLQDKIGCGATPSNHGVNVNLTQGYQTFTIPFTQFSGLNPNVLWAVVFQNIPSGVTVNVQNVQFTVPVSTLTFDNFSTPVDANNNVGGIHSDDHTLAASIAANTLTLHGATGGYWYSTFPLGTCGNESAYSSLSFTAKASSNVGIQVNLQDKVGCGATPSNHRVNVNLTQGYQTFTIPFSQFSGLNPSVLWAVVFQSIPSGVTVNVQNVQFSAGGTIPPKSAIVAVGAKHSCVVSTGGNVFCWGSNNVGQLGDGTGTDRSTRVKVLGVGGLGNLSGITSIAAGGAHTCALSSAGNVYCWGLNDVGALGDGTSGVGANRSTPVEVLGVGGSGNLSGIIAITAGAEHTCAVSSAGNVYCWGYNHYGNLGIGTAGLGTERLTPVEVLGVGGSGNLSGISAIAAGYDHTCAVSSAGNVYCWGLNDAGNLGDGTGIDRSTPVEVLGVGGSGNLSGISAIGGGVEHSCAVSSAGNIYCWGANGNGQLGDGTLTQRSFPGEVLGVGGSGNLSGISAIAGEYNHNCAVSNAGNIYCWGSNNVGQLGDGTGTDRSTPIEVLGVGGLGNLSGIIAIAAGQDHSCAVSSDGSSTYCWGENSNGQLGDGTTTNRSTPVGA